MHVCMNHLDLCEYIYISSVLLGAGRSHTEQEKNLQPLAGLFLNPGACYSLPYDNSGTDYDGTAYSIF